MPKSWPVFMSFLLIIIMFGPWLSTNTPLRTRVMVSGASTLVPILTAAKHALETQQPTLRIDVVAGGSGRGIRDAQNGHADLGAVARAVTADERAALTVYPVAHDGIAIIVDADNSLNALTLRSLRTLYAATALPATGAARPLTRVSKALGHGTRDAFLAATGLTAATLQAAVIAGNNADVIRAVVAHAPAIGYVSHVDAARAIAAGAPIRILALDGVAPSPATLHDGRYPLSRTLSLVSQTPLTAGARALIEYLASPQGRTLIQEAGYVPLP